MHHTNQARSCWRSVVGRDDSYQRMMNTDTDYNPCLARRDLLSLAITYINNGFFYSVGKAEWPGSVGLSHGYFSPHKQINYSQNICEPKKITSSRLINVIEMNPLFRRALTVLVNYSWLINTWDGETSFKSGKGAYAGAARRRVHLVTVLLRPTSGHRPGRRQARILQIGLRLAIAQADARPAMHVSFR